MTATTSSRTRGFRSALIGVVLAAAAATPFAASAAEGPNLAGGTINAGWTNNVTGVVLYFDTELLQTSTIQLVDKDLATVPGNVAVQGVALSFTPNALLDEAKAPYKATIVARSLDGETPLDSTFRIDRRAPLAPVIDAPSGGPAPVAIVNDDRTVSGSASDYRPTGGDLTSTSGIAATELHFYQLQMPDSRKIPTDPTALPSDPAVVPAFAYSAATAFVSSASKQWGTSPVTVQCVSACPADADWVSEIPASLPQGLWSVKAQSIDVAGNKSPESAGVVFLKVA